MVFKKCSFYNNARAALDRRFEGVHSALLDQICDLDVFETMSRAVLGTRVLIPVLPTYSDFFNSC